MPRSLTRFIIIIILYLYFSPKLEGEYDNISIDTIVYTLTSLKHDNGITSLR